SGGPDSPYLLLSMGPPVLATLYGGLRAGFMTGMLATTLLALITLSQTAPERDVLDIAPGAALYLAFVLLVGVIRRLFEDIHQQAVELAEEKQTATRQLERLEQINSALSRLSEDVSAGRLNAVEVSQDTLDAILERFPGSQGKMAVYNESGTVFLSVRGIPAEQGHGYKFSLSTADAEVGHLELITPRELIPAEMEDVGSIIYP